MIITSFAAFDYQIMDNVVIIIDLHNEINNSMSVTNDVERVIKVILADIKSFDGLKVIYKDTYKQWDEIVVENDKFCRFKALNKETLFDAIIELKKREPN